MSKNFDNNNFMEMSHDEMIKTDGGGCIICLIGLAAMAIGAIVAATTRSQ